MFESILFNPDIAIEIASFCQFHDVLNLFTCCKQSSQVCLNNVSLFSGYTEFHDQQPFSPIVLLRDLERFSSRSNSIASISDITLKLENMDCMTALFDILQRKPFQLQCLRLQCCNLNSNHFERCLNLESFSCIIRFSKLIEFGYSDEGYGLLPEGALVALHAHAPLLTTIDSFRCLSDSDMKFLLSPTTCWRCLTSLPLGHILDWLAAVDPDEAQYQHLVNQACSRMKFPAVTRLRLEVMSYSYLLSFFETIVAAHTSQTESFFGVNITSIFTDAEEVDARAHWELQPNWRQFFDNTVKHMPGCLFPNLRQFDVNNWLPSQTLLQLICQGLSMDQTGAKRLAVSICPGLEDPSTLSMLESCVHSLSSHLSSLCFRKRQFIPSIANERSNLYVSSTRPDYTSSPPHSRVTAHTALLNARSEYVVSSPGPSSATRESGWRVQAALHRAINSDGLSNLQWLGFTIDFLDYLYQDCSEEEVLVMLSHCVSLQRLTLDCGGCDAADWQSSLLYFLRLCISQWSTVDSDSLVIEVIGSSSIAWMEVCRACRTGSGPLKGPMELQPLSENISAIFRRCQ